MTIKKALSEGNNHILCADGTEFDVKPVKDGGYVLHHIEKNGRRQAKNRLKMTDADTELWIKKKCGGIAEVGPGKYEKFIPEKGEFTDKGRKKKKPLGGYEFEEEEKPIDADAFFNKIYRDDVANEEGEPPAEPIEHEEEPLIDINSNEEEREMPDLERPSDKYTGNTAVLPQQEIQQQAAHQYNYTPDSSYGQNQYSNQYDYGNRSEKTSVIYEDMSIKGDIETQGSVEVYGILNGNINAQGNVMVTGMIKGNVSAMDMSITGSSGAEIIGDIGGNAIQINAGSVVVGNIRANDLTVEGAVQGDIDVNGRVVVKASSIIKGNISSQKIVIEDGAAIDGHCVQKYAEVTPESFFGGYVSKFTQKPLNPEDYKKEKDRVKKAKAEKAKAVADAIENGDDSVMENGSYNGYSGMTDLIAGKQ